MCGRYTLAIDDNFKKRFEIDDPVDIKSRYNIAPSQILPVIVRQNPEPLPTKSESGSLANNLEMMKWGLIPFWAKDAKMILINARSETLPVKPAFRQLLQNKRCLVPATGFYEWKRLQKTKIPYYISLKNNDYFSFAGLYDIWKNPNGEEVRTFTIITTTPNKLMAPIHNRMPVIFNKSNEGNWLENNNINQLQQLLKPYSEKEMTAHPVSTDVNNPGNDHKNLIQKLNL